METKNILMNGDRTLSMQTQWLVPSDNIDRYIAKVRQIPILSVDEEFSLARKFKEENNLDAAQKLVVHHLKFVVHIARGFIGYGLQLGDLIQEGNIGLMKAVKRFEPSRGIRLVSFAVHWIKSEIHEFVIRNWRLVKIATTKEQRKLFFNLRSMKKSLTWLTHNEATDIAKELDVSVKNVYEMEQRINGQDISFAMRDDDEDDNFAPEQWLADEESDPAYYVAESEEQNRTLKLLSSGLNSLDERSRAIIEARWIRDDKTTLQDLATKYQVSAERIRQIEQQAMKQLRTHLEGK